MRTRVAGHEYDLHRGQVERAMARIEPEPIQEHYVVVSGRRYPPKQVLAVATRLDRGDFTTHQARSVLRRLGFGAFRRAHRQSAGGTHRPGGQGTAAPMGPHRGSEAELLEPFVGRWVAQDGLDVLFDASSPEAVVQWLRRHGRRARVWRVPDSPAAAGSTLSAP
jgi:hypothetical protein